MRGNLRHARLMLDSWHMNDLELGNTHGGPEATAADFERHATHDDYSRAGPNMPRLAFRRDSKV